MTGDSAAGPTASWPAAGSDVHQHLWPAAFVEALRRRTHPPYLRGWTLVTATEAPFEVTPAHHDPATRRALDGELGRVCLGLSTPVGVEELDPDDAAPLLDAWHEGVAELGAPFAGWAAVTRDNPDLDGLADRLTAGRFVGLQVSATWLATPDRLEALAPVLQVCEHLDRPVLVHPGAPARSAGVGAGSGGSGDYLPGWWAAMTDYPAQLQRAYWAWYVAGRSLLPRLRIGFVAGAGLAPALHERFAARSGQPFRLDPWTFLETSSLGRQGVDALTRAVGIDVVVNGTDRPYAGPMEHHQGDAARQAVAVVNPRRYLTGCPEGVCP